MKRSRILLSVSALLVTALLGWYARGAFDAFIGERRSAAPGVGDASRSDVGRHGESLQPWVPRDGAARPGSVSGREPSAGTPPYAASVEPAPPAWVPQPGDLSTSDMLPPNVKSGDVEVSPDGTTRLLVRVAPETAPLQASPAVAPPLDINSAVVEVSPDGATRLAVQPQPPAPQALSRGSAVSQEPAYRAGVYSPDGVMLEKLPPGGKAPATPAIPKKSEK